MLTPQRFADGVGGRVGGLAQGRLCVALKPTLLLYCSRQYFDPSVTAGCRGWLNNTRQDGRAASKDAHDGNPETLKV